MRKCIVTERTTSFGHNVAHCNKKTKRTFRVNMISKRVWVEELNKFVRVKLSARGLKTLDKNGSSYLLAIDAI
jgi:large subunit ribosomal protein L28